MAHLLGIDLGSSSVKATLVDAATGARLATAQSPADRELTIAAPQPGWAEQDPDTWWQHLGHALDALRVQHDLAEVTAVGIAYQMHGLVLVDAGGAPVRPAIIWCDGRAVDPGRRAARKLGIDRLAATTLNAPGNFTASKLAWVAEHEPDTLARATTAFLPGDYLAYRLTGERQTTASGLSEMILWDYAARALSTELLDALGLDERLLPARVPTFGMQARVSPAACTRFGFRQNPVLSYRAGDQPNNAYALKALAPGEVAATAGTSGVVYAVTDRRRFDHAQRVNTFLHVNDAPAAERLGLLLCVNGTGAAYAWLRRLLAATGDPLPYPQLNALANAHEVSEQGLRFYPFGNGPERLLANRAPGARLEGIAFGSHGPAHVAAAVRDGIAAALAYGTRVLATVGTPPRVIRAGRANLFLSDRFCEAFTALTCVPLELYDTDGARGAALAAGVGACVYASHAEALAPVERLRTYTPEEQLIAQYAEFFARWQAGL